MGYYHSMDDLIGDFKAIVAHAQEVRCRNRLARNYLEKVKGTALQHMERKRNDFVARWRAFFDSRFRENEEPRVNGSWFKYPGAKRQYFSIDDYRVVTCADMKKLPANLNEETLPQVLQVNTASEEYHQTLAKM